MAERITWPSQHRTAPEVEPAHAQQVLHSPTWPTQLPQAMQTQPNLFLQLTQILEWEIWNHNQTLTILVAEKHRVSELNVKLWKLLRERDNWEETCQTVYGVLDNHRRENAAMKGDIESLTAELEYLRQLKIAQPQFMPLREAEKRLPVHHINAHQDGGLKIEEVEVDEAASWRGVWNLSGTSTSI